METKTCNVCKHSKHLDQYYNNKKGKFGKGNTCKPCMLSLNKQTFEYTCPTCNKTSFLQRDPYRVAVKNNRECNSCAVKKWHIDRYGKKQDRTFTSTCSNCGDVKKHKWKNLSDIQLDNIQKTMDGKLCKKCSNSLYYTLPEIKTNTKPERIFKQYLEGWGISYIQNYKFKHHHFDFYLTDMNILVEIDGNYWHGKNLGEHELNPSQIKSRKNDLKKNKICLENNQPLIRLWEDELNEKVIKNKLQYEGKYTI
jgi:G:T-mismatch repair DNA endonuclease (very short patch repair protein)